MAFQNKNLSVIAYANGFTLWHYISDGKLSGASAGSFFNPVSPLMNTGDIIIINAADTTGLRKVTATSPNVTVASI